VDEWVKLFREIGFPAAVAAFVLWRLEATLREVVRELINVRLAMAAILAQSVKAAEVLATKTPAFASLLSPPWDGEERRGRRAAPGAEPPGRP